MPKSSHMANSHAKVTAAAIMAELQGLEINPHPMLTNVCMSYVDATHVIHVASVHEYQAPKKSFFTIGGSGGVSDVRSDLEGRYAGRLGQEHLGRCADVAPYPPKRLRRSPQGSPPAARRSRFARDRLVNSGRFKCRRPSPAMTSVKLPRR